MDSIEVGISMTLNGLQRLASTKIDVGDGENPADQLAKGISDALIRSEAPNPMEILAEAVIETYKDGRVYVNSDKLIAEAELALSMASRALVEAIGLQRKYLLASIRGEQAEQWAL